MDVAGTQVRGVIESLNITKNDQAQHRQPTSVHPAANSTSPFEGVMSADDPYKTKSTASPKTPKQWHVCYGLDSWDHATACPLWDKQCRTSQRTPPQIPRALLRVLCRRMIRTRRRALLLRRLRSSGMSVTGWILGIMPLLVRSGTSSAERLSVRHRKFHEPF